MGSHANDWTDERVETYLGRLLQAGVLAAALTVLAGGALFLAGHGFEPVHYAVFHGEPPDLRNPFTVAADAAALEGRGLIQLGLLLLIATPVARVFFSVFAFLRERDGVYVAVTLIVLAALAYSLSGGMP